MYNSESESDGNFELMNGSLVGTKVDWVPKVTDVDEPDENTDGRDDFSESVTAVFEFTL